MQRLLCTLYMTLNIMKIYANSIGIVLCPLYVMLLVKTLDVVLSSFMKQ
jgi:hypothetical protein